MPAMCAPAKTHPLPAAPRSFWQRRVRDPLLAQLKQGVTPDKVALTIAVGVACGLFPFLGFTTLLCFLVALRLRLNQPIIHIVNQLMWPIHLPMIMVYVSLGQWLYGAKAIPYNPDRIAHLLVNEPGEFFHRFGVVSAYAFLAWLITAPVVIAAIYFPSRPLLRKFAAARRARSELSD